jgi:hypothetical protein
MLLNSCSSAKVLSDIDQEANFNDYKTYSWSEVDEPLNTDYPQYDNTLNRKRWENAIDVAMQREGFTLVPSNADLQLDYHIQFEHNSVIDHGTYNEREGDYIRLEPTSVYQFDEGIFTIHMIDLKSKQLVWQGVITKVLDITQIDKVDSSIKQAVNRLFEKLRSQIKTEKNMD